MTQIAVWYSSHTREIRIRCGIVMSIDYLIDGVNARKPIKSLDIKGAQAIIRGAVSIVVVNHAA